MESYTLDEQITFLKNAEEIALSAGSLAHNVLFIRNMGKIVNYVNKCNLISFAQLESLRYSISRLNVMDFYIAKFPVSYGHGPFLFAYNKEMRQYIQDLGISLNHPHYLEDDYLSQSINSYVLNYYVNQVHIQRRTAFSRDPNHTAYFPVELLYDWFEQYGKFEFQSSFPFETLCPGQRGEGCRHLSEQLNIIEQLLTASDLHIGYRVHIARAGWQGWVIDGMTAGKAQSGLKIETFSLQLCGRKGAVQYQSWYARQGWSVTHRGGEVAGTTGQGLPIDGIRIWLALPGLGIKYRTFASGSWSVWHMNGQGLKMQGGFEAIQILLYQRTIESQVEKS